MSVYTLDSRLQQKNDTATNWSTNNPVLLKGEIGVEIDSGKFKIGDGTNTWSSLEYHEVFSTTEKNKLSGINQGAQVNQNAFSNVVVGSTTIAADSQTDTLTLTAGNNITITPDASGDNVTFSVPDMSYSHPNSGVTAGTYKITTVNAQGHVTSGSNPTTLSGFGITDAASKNHTHDNADITSLDAAKLTGTIDLARLPKGALERMTIVANDTARFALTTATIQVGDTVKVEATNMMYYVVDETKLSTEAGYESYMAGRAAAVPWSGVTDKPSTFTPSTHTHTKSQISDFPASMPASDVSAWAKASTKPSYTPTEVGVIGTAPTSGQIAVFDGTSGKIKSNGISVEKSVPSDAIFTDTIYSHPTTSGNKHIPSGGTSGQILRWSADGTATWGADNNTTYGVATSSTLGLLKSTSAENGVSVDNNGFASVNNINISKLIVSSADTLVLSGGTSAI